MKAVRLICCLCLLAGSLLAFNTPGIAFAQDEQPEEWVKLAPTYPKMEAIAGDTFEFEMKVTYKGKEARDFDLDTIAPPGWEVYMTPPYEKEKKVSAIRLLATPSGETIRVVVSAPFWPLPEPGEYDINVTISDGELQDTTTLKAEITARYTLMARPATERYNTTATAGKDNFFSVKVANLGTAPIENVKFSTTKPEGWTIEFTPDKIDTLEAIDEQTIDVNIKPPTRTVAGDYEIGIRASGKQSTAEEVKIRVTVESPTIWGWVGVGIILIVVIGLGVIFMRFSRR
ncbi:NEW3 domain-containing protein [Chloroflexota bacterium]